ncbi:hypothetical protein FIBSPDRAFT_1048782 [Athelia psychrophila]|uniref:Uncharacterized protein n=1 Tax=Athelia psychrophila TaxID=1759441 RepID=A0A166D924_9AGAM|nr:hypothetical protein FIBSPDRAFT_1048782 [Fibularhizoctonia sp. CBS 109695]
MQLSSVFAGLVIVLTATVYAAPTVEKREEAEKRAPMQYPDTYLIAEPEKRAPMQYPDTYLIAEPEKRAPMQYPDTYLIAEPEKRD